MAGQARSWRAPGDEADRAGEGDPRQRGGPVAPVQAGPADLFGAGVVVDDREGVVAKRQIRDELGDAVGERCGADQVRQPDLRLAAERGAYVPAERAWVDVDLLEQGGRIGLVVASGRPDGITVEARFADWSV